MDSLKHYYLQVWYERMVHGRMIDREKREDECYWIKGVANLNKVKLELTISVRHRAVFLNRMFIDITLSSDRLCSFPRDGVPVL